MGKQLFFIFGLIFSIMVGAGFFVAGENKITDGRYESYEMYFLPKIHLIKGDITNLPVKVGAIVNAAKPSLLGGGGVDGAIHKAAGTKLRDYCEKEIKEVSPGVRCPVGEVRITPAFGISCTNKIIHTVGPRGDDKDREKLLADAYCGSLSLASMNKLESIAFPAISTGIYGYSLEGALSVVIELLHRVFWIVPCSGSVLKDIYFVVFDDKTFDEYKKQFDNEFFKLKR